AAVVARLAKLPVVVCVLGLFSFRSFHASYDLGQNAPTTLFLLATGCLLLHRGRDAAAGLAWSLLSYKTPWLLAAGWTAVVMGRPRCLLGGIAGATALALAATAAFGVESWPHWLERLRAMADFYAVESLKEKPALPIGVACDLRATAYVLCRGPAAKFLGLAALAGVALATAGLWRWSDARLRTVGATPSLGDHPAAGVLLAGLVLASPYMIYYDTTAFLLPLALLWRRFGDRPTAHRVALCVGTLAFYASIPIMHDWSAPWGGPFRGPPFATAAMLFLWAYACVQTVGDVRKATRPASPALV
ncbi:MAG: glycosyltransferase 87 family protein, partial [Planctomycetia bacterium]